MKNKETGYGRPILSNGWINFNLRLRNRIITLLQYRLLNYFSKLNDHKKYGSLFSRLSRRIIGGYLYSIKLELNNQCNLSCRMCYVPQNGTDLEFQQIEKLIFQIRNSGTRLEIIGGEPLMRKDLPEIVLQGKVIGRLPFISVYTNGTYATKELCTELKNAGLDAAIVSLISTKSDIHDHFTQTPGSWEKSIEGILNFRDAGVKTYTFSAIHKVNSNEIFEIQEFVTNKLMVEPLFYQYIPQLKNDPLLIDRNKWYKLKNKVLSEQPTHSAFVRDFDMLSGNACSGGNFVLTIKADGSVQPCPFISDITLGNIYYENIWRIFKNRYKGTRLSEFKCLPESCTGCSYASVCGGGCRAGNKVLVGSYLYPDFRCKGPYQSQITKDGVIKRIPCFSEYFLTNFTTINLR